MLPTALDRTVATGLLTEAYLVRLGTENRTFSELLDKLTVADLACW